MLIVAALLLTILIVRPFIIPLLASTVIAYLFYPIFSWMNRRISNRTLSALIVSLIILLLITVPIIMVVNTISKDAYSVYISSKQLLLNGELFENCTASLCTTIQSWLAQNQVHIIIQKTLEAGTTYLIENASRFLLTIPRRALETFITFFAVFYLLRDGDKITNAFKRLIVVKGGKKQHILARFNEVMYAVVFGSLLVAFIQGAMGAFGFALFGISSPIIWGIAMFLLALIPYVGTGIIWVPAAAIMVVEGLTAGQSFMVWKGIGLFAYGLLFIGSIDNILKPKIIGHRLRVHPILVLVGILGGLALMGIPGIVIGPVILAMTVTFLELYVVPHDTQKAI